jgi:hypothetical protein
MLLMQAAASGQGVALASEILGGPELARPLAGEGDQSRLAAGIRVLAGVPGRRHRSAQDHCVSRMGTGAIRTARKATAEGLTYPG